MATEEDDRDGNKAVESSEAEVKYFAEIVKPEDWDKYKEGLMDVENQAFSGTGFSERFLRNLVENEYNFTFMVKDGEKVVGYVNATPQSEESVYITSIAVLPSHQGRGIVGVLSSALEAEIVRKGYIYTEEDANDDNGYAEKIKKHYGDKVVFFGEPHDSPWGKQRFIKIKVGY